MGNYITHFVVKLLFLVGCNREGVVGAGGMIEGVESPGPENIIISE